MNKISNKFLLLLLIIIIISPFFMVKVNAVTDAQKDELKKLLKEDGFADSEIEILLEGMTDEEYESMLAAYKNAGTAVGDNNEEDDDEDDPEGTGTPATSPTGTGRTGTNVQSAAPASSGDAGGTDTNENKSSQKLAYTGLKNYYILSIIPLALLIYTGIKYRKYKNIK